MSGIRCLAIVPAKDEEESISAIVAEILEKAPDFDVLVVNDGSGDATAERAAAAGATVISHTFNLGIGGAVQSGYRHAFREGYDVAVQVDGDGQHDPGYLAPMLEALESEGQADFVVGSRFLSDDAGYSVPISRRTGGWIFSKVVSAIVRRPVTDPTSGFRMTNRKGIELFARDYPHDYPEVEAIIMVHAHEMQMHEVPVKMRVRGGGRSSITKLDAGYYMLRVMLAIGVGLFRGRPVPPPDDQALFGGQSLTGPTGGALPAGAKGAG